MKTHAEVYQEEQQQKTRLTAVRKSRPWTQEDDRVLITGGASTALALKLGRTYGGVIARKHTLKQQGLLN